MDLEKGRDKIQRRRWTHKVRTGCLTCRQRHKKCDETKPACKRCIAARLQCTGQLYGQNPITFTQPHHGIAPFSRRSRNEEERMFHIFCNHVTPNMFDIFDEEFWSVLLPRGAQVYPSVWHAAVATGALQQMLLAKEGGSKLDHHANLYAYALRSCNHSMQEIANLHLSRMTPKDREMVLLTCVVLICYSTIHRDHSQAMQHIHSGIRLSRSWSVGENSCVRECVTTFTSICARFSRLEMMVQLAPLKLEAPLPKDILVVSDEPFISAIDAYNELQIIDAHWKNLSRSEISPFGDISLQFVVQECDSLRRPFRLWQSKLEALRSFTSSAQGSNEEIRFNILRILELVMEAITQIDHTKGEVAWDDFNSNFARIVALYGRITKSLLNTEQAFLLNSVQFRSQVGMPLIATSCFCRKRRIREQANALLKRFPFVDSTFDSNSFVTILEMKAHHEEHGMLFAPLEEASCNCIFDSYICKAHRVCQLNLSPTYVTLRTGHDVTKNLPGSMLAYPTQEAFAGLKLEETPAPTPTSTVEN